ncbi:MAG: glycosyltransferase [Methylococcales bacterium]
MNKYREPTEIKWLELGKYFPPDMGGIERVSEACSRIANKNGCSVHVIAFSPKKSLDEVVPGIGRVSRYESWLKPASAPLAPGYLISALQALGEANFVHVHMPNPLAALAVWLRPGRYRLILHWHSDVVSQRRIYWIYRWLESALLRCAVKVLVTTQAYADASPTLKSWRAKCVAIPPLTNIPALPPDVHTVAKTLLACGRLVPYKGFDVLVRAMAILPVDYRLRICGTGPLSNSLSRLIRSLGLQDRVELLGFVSDERLAELMAESDVFCMPSVTRAEAFGVAVIEAFAAGLPVVSSSLQGSGLKVINRDGVTGLQFPVGDADALAAAVRRICENRTLRHSMADSARSEFLERYTPESYAERFSYACFRAS